MVAYFFSWNIFHTLSLIKALDRDVSQLDDDNAFSDGKTADNWRNHAQEIFNEGYKLIQFAAEEGWSDLDTEEQEGYARLFRKFGRKRGVSSED